MEGSASGIRLLMNMWLLLHHHGYSQKAAFEEDPHPSSDCSPHGFMVLRIVGTILLMALGLVVGLLHCRKPRWLNLSSLCPSILSSTWNTTPSQY
ncbi:high affinity immunoglobulin epsilon receptor subunit alpha-like protein [Lates japonicus]|nr:high affinity immunoglobulin epsilon receptor subunit alpha-like protein [Lates japonicus]